MRAGYPGRAPWRCKTAPLQESSIRSAMFIDEDPQFTMQAPSGATCSRSNACPQRCWQRSSSCRSCRSLLRSRTVSAINMTLLTELCLRTSTPFRRKHGRTRDQQGIRAVAGGWPARQYAALATAPAADSRFGWQAFRGRHPLNTNRFSVTMKGAGRSAHRRLSVRSPSTHRMHTVTASSGISCPPCTSCRKAPQQLLRDPQAIRAECTQKQLRKACKHRRF